MSANGPGSDWLVVSSRENLEISAGLGWSMQGFKGRHKLRVDRIQPEERIYYYITGEQCLAGVVSATGPMQEAHDMIWVNLGRNPEEDYPWRIPIRPLLILPEDQWVPLAPLVPELDHFTRWPSRHWALGLQGQLHELTRRDGDILYASLDSE